ncbi:MAG: UDP-glucose 6-dehydrogenase [Acidobacteria bacterium]|nr:UDP-glucose 6-dehydrogenase [Acidobacteriota bacterium]
MDDEILFVIHSYKFTTDYEFMNDAVSVVGLGKLGLGLALCFASSGVETLGVDVKEDVVDAINNGKTPIVEPEYQELIDELGEKFRATNNHAEAIEKTDITFILVATPSIGDGRFSNRYVKSALKSLSEAFGKSKKPYHLFVISSTVVPGSTEKTFIPLIEQYSGRKYKKDFDVCFDPDFVALGSVAKDFRNPDLVIIGESRPEAGDKVEALHKKMCHNQPKIARMSLISAEVAKVSLNAYITMKISFANTIANLCERIPGTDVDAITSAIGVDKRISPYYLRGGLAFGGTCFPRDTKAFMTISQQYNLSPILMESVERVNVVQNKHLAETVKSFMTKEKKISVLGVAFKDKTPVVEASPAVSLIQELVIDDVDVTIYDPLAMESAQTLFDDEISYSASIEDCLNSSPVCVLTLMSKDYKEAIERFVPKEKLTVIDCWRQIDADKLHKNINLLAIGRFNDLQNGDDQK